MSTGTAPIEGVVASTNPKGVRLEGSADWLNYSKFTKPEDIDACQAGQRVSVQLDKAGFVRSLVNLDAPGGRTVPLEGTTATRPSTAPPTASPAPHSPSNGTVDKDRQIVRQSSLKAAVDIAAHNWHTISVADVLAIAEQLEAWVYR